MTQKAKKESKRAVGTFYEEAAVRYLKDQGYEILCRNFSCRQGEIDIVAREGEYLCFVEVKYRSTEGFGDGLAAVDRKSSSGFQEQPFTILQSRDMVWKHLVALTW